MPKYLEHQGIKRAGQAWRQEKQYEKLIEEEYKLLDDKITQEVLELFSRYGEEGVIEYSQLRVRLNQAELSMYRRKIESILAQNRDITDEDILLEIEKLLEYTSLTRLGSSMNAVEAHTLVTIDKSIKVITDSLGATYDHIYSYTNYDIQRKIGESYPMERETQAGLLAYLIESDDFTGLTYPEAVKGTRHRLTRDIKRKVSTSIKRKETPLRLARTLTKEVMGGKGYKVVRSKLREETTRVISETALDVYEQAGLDKFQYVATLDSRTTSICQNMDGTVHKIEDAEVGVNVSPLHYNCRSTVIAYIEDVELSERQRVARDPNSRQNYRVPGDISYKEWNRKYNQS